MSNIQRDKKGRFVQGHGWDQEVLDKISNTKKIQGWSVFFNECIECKTTQKKHANKGLCVTCYARNRYIKKYPEGLSIAYKGKGNPGWKGGLSNERSSIFRGKQYRFWRNSVFERDDYTCQVCKKKGGELNADHIIPWAEYKEGWFDINNGQTLCKLCHAIKTWGEHSRGVGRIRETQFKKGHKGYWTEERRKNRKPHSGDFKKGNIPWNKGIPWHLWGNKKTTS